MELRLANHLKRLGQADRNLRDHADPELFLLIYSSGGAVGIKHPAWDGSWPTPTAEDVDDLEELGYVRTEPGTNVKRVFSLTVSGREQAAALSDPAPTYVGGRAPPIDQVLAWLLEIETTAPENFDIPTRLIDAAVRSGYIAQTGREELSKQIIALARQGYVEGDLPDLEQATGEQRLGMSNGLKLTMKAHDRNPAVAPGTTSTSVNFYGSVVAGQIAAGNITNYANLGELLEAAEAELEALDDVEDDARNEARTLIDVLRGQAIDASVQITTGAGGVLLATVVGRLLGLPV